MTDHYCIEDLEEFMNNLPEDDIPNENPTCVINVDCWDDFGERKRSKNAKYFSTHAADFMNFLKERKLWDAHRFKWSFEQVYEVIEEPILNQLVAWLNEEPNPQNKIESIVFESFVRDGQEISKFERRLRKTRSLIKLSETHQKRNRRVMTYEIAQNQNSVFVSSMNTVMSRTMTMAAVIKTS